MGHNCVGLRDFICIDFSEGGFAPGLAYAIQFNSAIRRHNEQAVLLEYLVYRAEIPDI